MTTATHPPTIETPAASIGCPDWCGGRCEWEHDLATNSPIRWHEHEGWGQHVYAGAEQLPGIPSLTNWQVRISDTDSIDSMDATEARELAGYLIMAAVWVERHEAEVSR